MIYAALLRGINVGGNNKISMTELKACFEELGYKNVRTYINSGNVLFSSGESTGKIAEHVEAILIEKFPHTTMPIKVLLVSRDQLAAIIKNAPKGFGKEPGKYHSDAVFLIGKTSAEAMAQVEVNPEVDAAWPGDSVLYYRRLSAKRTKSRLSKVISKPIYKSMTIRSWNTTYKLFNLMQEMSDQKASERADVGVS